MTRFIPIEHDACGFLEVFTTEATGEPYAYRLLGVRRGPQLAIAGHGAPADAVFDRLLSIPSLPYIHGSLLLVQLDRLNKSFDDLDRLTLRAPIDRIFMLPSCETGTVFIRRLCSDVLRVVAGLGMIGGRGVAV